MFSRLRPKAEVYDLSVDSRRGYNLDVSLFERLASAAPRPAVPLVTLSTQRRMRPAIANLVRSTIYPVRATAQPFASSVADHASHFSC